jgi:choline dehydrogenase
MQYDDIIVGGGSAGAVLAARLSEDSKRNVLLLEAGPDYPQADTVPDDLLNAFNISVTAHDWGLSANAAPGLSIDFPSGKVTGGSSAVNAAMAIRGIPEDFEAWASAGNREWAWEKVLPYYRAIEDDRDFDGDLHGQGGPIPIVRWKDDELVPQQRAFLQACLERGFARVDDHNHPESTGVGPWPMNREGRTHVSTATAYLDPARQRLNLTIRPHCLVNRVLFEGNRANGVDVESGGELQRVQGRNVVLAAGAIMSPAILLRSGIGPRAQLEELGISCLFDRPRVGGNLIDHPATALLAVPKPGVCNTNDPVVQVGLRYTAAGSSHRNDMQLNMGSHIDLAPWPRLRAALGDRDAAFSLISILEKPFSRGRVAISSSDHHVPPIIDLYYHHDPEDMRRTMEGVRLAWDIVHTPVMRALHEGVLGVTEETIESDEKLQEFIRRANTTVYHPVGTCKMGPSGDPEAVVDSHGRVYGVQGLRVADASIMPDIPSANTNLTCIVIGERIAEWMKGDG